MGVMQGLTPAWFNGVDPFDALSWEETVGKFKERYSKGGYLESLLKQYLLDANTLTFTMVPDKNYGQNLASEEAARLAAELDKVGGEGKAREDLVKQELKLLEIQENARNQDLSCLPTVKVDDIPREMERKPLQHGKIGNVPVQWRTAPTNGLTYFRGMDFSQTAMKMVLIPEQP
jgi:Zn-dependent M16 (insulinase) family peptidase